MDKNVIKLLNTLFENGYKDEKSISTIGVKELVEMKCCNEATMKTLLVLQEAIKGNKVISFLSGSIE